MNISSDRNLVESLQKGDLKAFDTIFKKYSNGLYGFALKYLKSREEAEELVQDLFLKIWENRNNLDKESSLKAYMFTISYHNICRIFRKRSYQIKLNKELIITADHSFSLEDQVSYESLLDKVNELIERLPSKQKTIFIKSRREGKSSREISSEMNLAPGTVDNNISEALKFLRNQISKENFSFLLFYYIFIH